MFKRARRQHDYARAALANAAVLAPTTSPDWPRTTGTTVHEALASLLDSNR